LVDHDGSERPVRGLHLRYQRLFLAIALYTAEHSSAILELTLDRVDLERRTIDFGPPNGKKRRPHHQPMVPALYELLTEAKTSARSPFVIGDRAAIGSIKRGFKADRHSYRSDRRNGHILRHRACTWMMQAGVPTSEIAGYAVMAEATVQRIYGSS
jgi:integrase